MRKLGNRSGGLPYTVLLDRRGALKHQHLGALQAPQLREVLALVLN